MCIITDLERELKLRSKAPSTIKQYSKQFKMFVEYFKNSDIRYLSESDIKGYLVLLHFKYRYSSIVHAIASIEFFYLNINSRKRTLNLPRPKKGKYIPTVLSISEVKSMIDATNNLKHKCIIDVLFRHGLRRQELIDLKLTDIDSANMLICVKNSKGAKDRNIPLSEDCLNNIRKYYFYSNEKPKVYLFEGCEGKQYSATSIYNIIVDTAKLAGIRKNVHPHTLRHSFASHLVKLGVNLAIISEWMGHNSIKTTDIYTHIFYEPNTICY